MNAFLDRLENAIICVALLSALALGVSQVVLRYVFNIGFVWIEAVFVTLTVLGAMIGASRAAAQNEHIRLTFVIDRLRGVHRKVAELVAIVVAIIYSGFLAYAGFLFAQFLRQVGATSVETGIPDWIVFSIIPFSMTLFIIRYLQQITEIWGSEHVESKRVLD